MAHIVPRFALLAVSVIELGKRLCHPLVALGKILSVGAERELPSAHSLGLACARVGHGCSSFCSMPRMDSSSGNAASNAGALVPSCVAAPELAAFSGLPRRSRSR